MTTIYIPGTPTQFPNYYVAVKAAGGIPCFHKSPQSCDALLLPGGGDLAPWRYGQENTASHEPDSERDHTELMLLDLFASQKKPILGICRGLQVINVFFGGTLLQDISGHSSTAGMDRLHKVRSTSSPLRTLCGHTAIVNSAHHQAVDRLGSHLNAVQWAPDGIIESLCHRCLPIWGLQWHPERLNTTCGNALFFWFLSLCS